MSASVSEKEAGLESSGEMERIERVIITPWSGCGLQCGKIEGDTFYFYDDQSYLENIYSKECFFENFEDSLQRWVKEALKEIEQEGFEVSADVEIVNKDEYIKRIFEEVEKREEVEA